MAHVIVVIRGFFDQQDGQDLIEYALLVALIALVVVGAATQLGATINSVFWQPIAQSF
jgi:pilus assembly protein Flp/PilA